MFGNNVVSGFVQIKQSFVDIISKIVQVFIEGVDSFFKPSIVNQKSIELGGLSMRWIYLGIPIGFACMSLFTIEKVLGNIISIKNLNSNVKEGVNK